MGDHGKLADIFLMEYAKRQEQLFLQMTNLYELRKIPDQRSSAGSAVRRRSTDDFKPHLEPSFGENWAKHYDTLLDKHQFFTPFNSIKWLDNFDD